MANYILSKTSFVKSVQCLKSFHYYKYFYHLKDPISKDKRAIFNRGIHVGEIAREIFKGGIDVSPENIRQFEQSVKRTEELIHTGCEVIYEAAFIFDEVLVAVDLLVKQNNKWVAYEVKSSLKISAAYVLDASLQYYVIKNSLSELSDFCLLTLNSDYVYDGILNHRELFKITSVLHDAQRNLNYIENRIRLAKETIENPKSPDIPIGPHCFKPYQCDFFGTCWKQMPARNIFTLNSLGMEKQIQLFNSGVKNLDDITDFEGMSDLNKRQITAWQHKEKIIDRARISEFINSLTYPIAFFDIELYTPAIPVFKGTKPYQQLPFLFSIHYLKSKNDDLAHDFFYANPGNDPRKEFVEACINKLEHFTSIIVFDSNLEQGVLNALIAEFPEYKKEIEFIKKKIIDIAPLFTKLHYFEPNTIGSMSLKNLFATILDSDLFEQLKINSGAQASFAYNDLQSETNEIILNQVKEELINYCKADTFATASLFKHLKSNALI